MKCAIILTILALSACSSIGISGSGNLGSGTNVTLGAQVDETGVRPKGRISQRIF